jgi:hypothetical protein
MVASKEVRLQQTKMEWSLGQTLSMEPNPSSTPFSSFFGPILPSPYNMGSTHGNLKEKHNWSFNFLP